MINLFLFLFSVSVSVSVSAFAQDMNQAIMPSNLSSKATPKYQRPFDPEGGKSVYRDTDVCTEPLLYDGVCPDYLVGGCGQRNDCLYPEHDSTHIGWDR